MVSCVCGGKTRRADDDRVGREGDARKRLARVSASADGARGVDEPERTLGLCDHDERREGQDLSVRPERSRPGGRARQDSRPVRDRVAALGCRAASRRKGTALVSSQDRRKAGEGEAHPSPFWRGRFQSERVHRTRLRHGRAARRRMDAVHVRHHRFRQAWRERTCRLRVGSDAGVCRFDRKADR